MHLREKLFTTHIVFIYVNLPSFFFSPKLLEVIKKMITIVTEKWPQNIVACYVFWK